MNTIERAGLRLLMQDEEVLKGYIETGERLSYERGIRDASAALRASGWRLGRMSKKAQEILRHTFPEVFDDAD